MRILFCPKCGASFTEGLDCCPNCGEKWNATYTQYTETPNLNISETELIQDEPEIMDFTSLEGLADIADTEYSKITDAMDKNQTYSLVKVKDEYVSYKDAPKSKKIGIWITLGLFVIIIGGIFILGGKTALTSLLPFLIVLIVLAVVIGIFGFLHYKNRKNNSEDS